jgi:hypothetical protein
MLIYFTTEHYQQFNTSLCGSKKTISIQVEINILGYKLCGPLNLQHWHSAPARPPGCPDKHWNTKQRAFVPSPLRSPPLTLINGRHQSRRPRPEEGAAERNTRQRETQGADRASQPASEILPLPSGPHPPAGSDLT